MSLNPQLVYMDPFQVQLWDKDLNVPLAGGVVTFYEDSNYSVLKPVYQLVGDGEGTYSYVELPNPLVLSGIGTFVDTSGNNLQVYMFPYLGTPASPILTVDLYYITVVSSTGVPQETINAWPPQLQGGGGEPINEADTTGNIIQNGQFVEVLFDETATSSSPVVFSTNGTQVVTSIAPDWDIVTTGNGTFSVYQQPITDITAPGNPAYALGIEAITGYTTPLILRQRILAPRIFSGSLVSGTFIAESTSGGPYTLTMSYVPSGTVTPEVICSGPIADTSFTIIANPVPVTITPGAAGAAPSAYVDITITIPLAASVQISCIQLCGVSGTSEYVAYLQNTPEEEINGLFHYYKPELDYKPISSYLVGWDFALNPAQFGFSGSLGALGANTGAYAWDQTILFQSTTNTISYASGTYDGLSINATGNTQLAMIQYLELSTVLNMVNSNLSSLVRVSVNTPITFTISLWITNNSTVPVLPTTLITTLDSNGHPSAVTSGWTEIKNSNGNATFKATAGGYTDFGFSGWLAGQIPSTTNNFAIVIGTSALVNTNALEFHSVSLVPGDIPTIPAPQTVDQVLSECEYYYEKSYTDNVIPGSTSDTANEIVVSMESVSVLANANAFSYATPFGWVFRNKKRVPPLVTIYDPVNGTAGNVLSTLYYAYTGTGAFTATTPASQIQASWWDFANGNKSIHFTPKNVNPLSSTNTSSSTNVFSSASIVFHYRLDSRLGVI